MSDQAWVTVDELRLAFPDIGEASSEPGYRSGFAAPPWAMSAVIDGACRRLTDAAAEEGDA